ncbi:MAG: glycosyltransferase family 9 protein [Phycisphaerae bacterium]
MTPQRILIIKPSSLGDVATTLPLLCDLRRACPEAKIDWLVAPAFAALVRGHDALNEVIVFERKELAAWWRSPAAFARFRTLTRRLADGQYDCVVDAQGLLRSGFFSWKTGARMRIGFADAREGGSFFYTHKVPIKRREAMAVVRMRALLDPLGISHEHAPEYRVPLDPDSVRRVADLVPGNAIGFIPGSRGEGKRWEPEGFASVIQRLANHRPAVLFGSPDEQPLCEEIANRSGSAGHPRINLAGRTSVADMVAALARCSMIIGNDTGPLHVAVALGKPILGLYGRTDPHSVGPYGQLENVIRFNDKPWPEVAGTVVARTTAMESASTPAGLVSKA